jgi:phosphocarrier protein
MLEKTVTVQNRAGVHARPSALIVRAIKDAKSDIYFQKGVNKINAKSIMGIITLGAGYGQKIDVIVDGPDEQVTMDKIVNLFDSKFEEDDGSDGGTVT